MKIYYVSDNSRSIVFKRRIKPFIDTSNYEFKELTEIPEDKSIIIFLVFKNTSFENYIFKNKNKYLIVYDNTNDIYEKVKPNFFRWLSWNLLSVLNNKTHDGIDFLRKIKNTDLIITGSEQQMVNIMNIIKTSYFVQVDPINNIEYKKDLVKSRNEKPHILWEGTEPSFLQFDFLVPILSNLSRTHEFVLIILCDKLKSKKGKELEGILKQKVKNVKFFEWTLENFVLVHSLADIGLAPIWNHIKFNYSKPHNKLISYNAFRIPFVCSNIPSYSGFVKKYKTGLVSDVINDWDYNLKLLLEDEDLRLKMGSKGYEIVWNQFSEQYFIESYYSQLVESWNSKFKK